MKKTTIIITTHYIEEARHTHTVGFMRHGRLIEENAPTKLLEKHQTLLLKDVFLKLCHSDSASRRDDRMYAVTSNIHNDGCGIQFAEVGSSGFSEQPDIPYPKHETRPSRSTSYRESIRRSFNRILALTTRNYCNMCRTPIFIIGLIVLPTIHVILTALTIGQDPKEFSVGVVNHEYLDWQSSCNATMTTCGSHLSCMFLDSLKKRDGFFDLVPVQSEHEALERVKQGEMWGYFSIPDNYSSSIVSRVIMDHFPDNSTLKESIINLKLDMSQYLAGLFIIKNAYESFESYIRESIDACGGNVREMELPLNVSIPVYGSVDSSYMEYIIPGVLLLSLFVIMLTFTAVCVITDKKQKTFDRSRVAGVTTLDIMISNFITDATVVIFQAGLGTLILIFGFNLKVQGSIISFLLLLVVSGFYGHVSGLLFGAICHDEIEALFLAIFAYLPILMLSGVLWPLQAMHPILRQFTYCLPLTLACESLRSIISRGLGASHIMVWPGIAILVGWALIFWFGAWFMFQRMTKVKQQKVQDS